MNAVDTIRMPEYKCAPNYTAGEDCTAFYIYAQYIRSATPKPLK
jgi:hypothetical protein